MTDPSVDKKTMSTEQHPTDQSDVACRFEGGSPVTLVSLYRRYWQEICRYIQSKFGAGPPDPEDVVQTTFVKYAALKHKEEVENPRAFLYATARNVVIDYHRREQVQLKYAEQQSREASEKKSDEISPERVLIGKERLNIMEQAIRRLPQQQRRVVVLHRIHGLSYTQIADKTGSSEATVRRHVASAMKRIQIALQHGQAVGRLDKHE